MSDGYDPADWRDCPACGESHRCEGVLAVEVVAPWTRCGDELVLLSPAEADPSWVARCTSSPCGWLAVVYTYQGLAFLASGSTPEEVLVELRRVLSLHGLSAWDSSG